MTLDPNANDKKPSSAEKVSARESLKALGLRLWRLISHNLFWKLLAGFLALCLWAGLITQDPTLTRERIFSDVPVTLTGADVLRRNGLIVLSGINGDPLTVRMRVDVPQREYTTVSAGNYNPRIDLSRITETGIQTLRVASTSVYGTVREISPDSVEVVVDEYVTNYRVPVNVERIGQYPKGFYGASPSLEPNTVTVSGPKSIVNQIARVVADFDVSTLPAQAGATRTAVPVRFTDASGNPVESGLIDVTNAGVLIRSVIVEQTLYATKTLPISPLAVTVGTPAAGYEVKSITATPNLLVAAGDDIGLNALDTLFLDSAIDVAGKSENFSVEVDIRQPSELVYLSSKSIMFTIEISPIIGTREFSKLPFVLRNQTKGFSAAADTQTVSVTLSGPVTLLDSLRTSHLTAYVDVGGLTAGEHELPILLDIENADQKKFTYDISPKIAAIRIAAN